MAKRCIKCNWPNNPSVETCLVCGSSDLVAESIQIARQEDGSALEINWMWDVRLTGNSTLKQDLLESIKSCEKVVYEYNSELEEHVPVSNYDPDEVLDAVLVVLRDHGLTMT